MPTTSTGPQAGGQETVDATPGSTGSVYNQWNADGEDITPSNQYTAFGVDQAFQEEGQAGTQWYVPTPGEELAGSNFTYADPTAFQNPNAQDIYGVINYGLNNMSQQRAPTAGTAATGKTAQLAPSMMLQGAQIAPQMLVDSALLNTGADQQYQQAQNTLANQLYAQSQGQGPSVAEMQAQMQREQAVQAQMAAMASGGGSPLGMRAAQLEASRQQQAAAQTGALGRSQEAMAAQQALAGVVGGARGQSQTTAQTQAQLQQQALLANQGSFNQATMQQAQLQQQAGLSNQQIAQAAAQKNAEMQQQVWLANQQAQNQFSLADQTASLQQNELNNQLYTQMLQQYQQENQQDITNAVAYQQLMGQEQLGMLQLNAGMESASGGITSGLASAAMAAGGAMLAMSDRRAKTNVKPAGSALRAFLDAVGKEY